MAKGIKVLIETDKYCIVHTTNLLNTIFYMQTQGWRIKKIEADDFFDLNQNKRIEGNIVYYAKK